MHCLACFHNEEEWTKLIPTEHAIAIVAKGAQLGGVLSFQIQLYPHNKIDLVPAVARTVTSKESHTYHPLSIN